MFTLKPGRTRRKAVEASRTAPILLFFSALALTALIQKPAAAQAAQPGARTTNTARPLPNFDPARRISLVTADLVYNAKTERIIASLPSTAGAKGNSIVFIDPQTLAVSDALFVGSEPGKLALSDNNIDLYVALNGSASVRRVNLKTGKVGMPFTLGERFGPLRVEDMEVMPGNPNVVAISRQSSEATTPRHGGVAVYDNGVQRPTTTPDHTGSNVIEWGAGGRVYGYDQESTDFGFRRMEVTASGIAIVDVTKQLTNDFRVDITYSNGRIYMTSGAIIDDESKTLVGTLNTSGLVCPDAALKRAWVLSTSRSGVNKLKAFNTDTFLEVASQPLPDIEGTPTRLIRWGKTGLAFRTNGGQVVIIPNAPGL